MMSMLLLNNSVHIIGTTCFDKCFLLHRITGRYCFAFFLKIDRCYPEGLFNGHVLDFFEIGDLKKIPHFIFYLHNDNKMLIPKFQNEALVYHAC